MQTLGNALPPEIVLTEYQSFSDSEWGPVLFGLSEQLAPYLERGWLARTFTDGRPCVKAAHYIGLLPYMQENVPRVLLIIPKGSGGEPNLGLLRFLELMALAAGDEEFDAEEFESTLVGRTGTSRFMGFLAGYYGQLLQQLCRRDFRSYYRVEEGELRSRLRGQLKVQRYVQNCVRGQSHRLPCRWEEFTPDNWDNRVLWTAVRGLKRAARSLDTAALDFVRKHFESVTPWFAPVSEVPIAASDLHRTRLDRTSRYYRRALVWARLIIQGTDLPSAGGSVPPMAFDANDVFERFAEVVTRSSMPSSSFWPVFQEQYPFLRGQQKQTRRPDIVVSTVDGTYAVGDAKYKEVLENVSAGDLSSLSDIIRCGISPSDWNQLYVYMRVTNASRGFFIVPFWKKEGDASILISDYAFTRGPVNEPVYVAVLGLNLLHSIRRVKRDAAVQLKAWLQTGADPAGLDAVRKSGSAFAR